MWPLGKLEQLSRVVVHRVKANRHVFVEQSYGSESTEEPEMSDVRKLIEEGKLICLKVDGFQFGYRDKESKLPHKKPSSTLLQWLQLRASSRTPHAAA